VTRVPLFSGSRVPLVALDDDALLLTPPPPLEPLGDVAAAVGEALRYPLSGPGLAGRAAARARATIVVEPRSLPLPDAPNDPRRAALAAVLDELDRLGVRADRQTILIAGGLGRRAGRRELESILHPTRARDFRGTVVVHDAAAAALRRLELRGAPPVHIHEALFDTDLIVSMTAAETSERGGASVLLDACAAADIARPEPAPSLLAPSLSPTGILAGKVAAALSERCAVTGVSIVLDHPRLTGRFRGYPWSAAGIETVSRSQVRRALNTMPGPVRNHMLDGMARELNAVAILAGPPAVSHAEALLRGVSLRGIRLDAPLDTIVVPVPWQSLNEPREPLNPLTAAALGLGHALRLWRDASPLREGGTIVLLHDLRRAFGQGSQAPYGTLFRVLREGPPDEDIAAAREADATDARALAAYRRCEAPHPLLPYLDWASCGPALARSGSVLVAGCRDAGAARALGLVPTHNISAALEMARGVAGGSHRLGVLVAPPYAPLVVG
jgi:hypothetical protein